MTRVLVLTPRSNRRYRDACLADSRERGENPVSIQPMPDEAYARAAQAWIDVCDAVIVYSDYDVDDVSIEIADDAGAMSLVVEWRTIGGVAKPTIRERITEAFA